MAEFKERAFLVCRDSQGKLVRGPTVTGNHGSVDMPTRCPADAVPLGVFHTHPPDSSLEPSDADLRQTQQAGLSFVCVGFKARVKCHPIRQKGT